jgi:hypothetical protein
LERALFVKRVVRLTATHARLVPRAASLDVDCAAAAEPFVSHDDHAG